MNHIPAYRMMSWSRAVAAGLLLLAAFAPQAAVYRCQVDGRTVFTDTPCAAGAEPEELPPVGQMPAGDQASDLAEAYDERRNRQRETRDRENARWLQAHQARKEQDARFEAAIRDKRAIKGMNPDQVRRALGSPDEVERDAGRETWIYGSGKARRALVFVDGRLSIDRGTRR